MREKERYRYIILSLFLFLGVLMRYWVMTFGYNYDFESYCIVGDLAGHFHNVYAETARYNYGPIFFCFLGLLYRISFLVSKDPTLTYRVLVVSALTLADLGIAFYIADRKNIKYALVFFLNPVSIIITGFHNQFDNIAVLSALYSLYFYNEEKEIGKKDYLFILFMTASLMIKHILFLIPVFILLKKGLPLGKKIMYAFCPPLAFLIGFVPFALSSRAAFDGILYNVFLYRSSNNAPLLWYLYKLINYPQYLSFPIYIIIMCILGFVIRKTDFDYCLMVYLIAMVAFSSAIANQYLVIPMAALCILKLDVWNYIYMSAMTVFLFLNKNGFGQLSVLQEHLPNILGKLLVFYNDHGYIIAVWLLFFTLIYDLKLKKYIPAVSLANNRSRKYRRYND